MTLPTAGKARAHLRSRSISPETTRTFGLGYAPDCYYGDERPRRRRAASALAGEAASGGAAVGRGGGAAWGGGSLVEHLADAGFAPGEIVEAGLAVRTKRKRIVVGNERGGRDEDGASGDGSKGPSDGEGIDGHDYSDLMDRFRSRLIVPITDGRGQNVIALGGRHLESNAAASVSDQDGGGDEEENPRFAPAKYINSPDSPVFTKKDVLYNEHLAKRAVDAICSENDEGRAAVAAEGVASPPPPAVVVVEGYLDAIALANVGVGNAAASMGTALPLEQLGRAAAMGNVPGGEF